VRRIHRKVSTTNIAHSSNVEQIGSSEIENSIAIDIQLSIGSNYGAAEIEGLFGLVCVEILLNSLRIMHPI
jgi:hypothetical protein